MATVSPTTTSDGSHSPNASTRSGANRNRRQSSLRSFGPSLLAGVGEEVRLCFPVLDNSVPDRRPSSDWNEFISLGMSDDKESNPTRSIAARGRASSRSTLGRNSVVPNEDAGGDWERMIDNYDFETEVGGTASSSAAPPSGNLANRRSSSRSRGVPCNLPPAVYGSPVLRPDPVDTTTYMEVIPLVPKPKAPTKAALQKAANAASKALKKATAVHKKGAGYVGRPANAWILYRSEQIRILKSENSVLKKPQSDISKFIALMWRDETMEVRRHFEAMADMKKAEHQAMYPDYRFCPVRKGPKNRPSAPRVNAATTKKRVIQKETRPQSQSSRANSTSPRPTMRNYSPPPYPAHLDYGGSSFPQQFYDPRSFAPRPTTGDDCGDDPQHEQHPEVQNFLDSIAATASYNQRQDPRSQIPEAENWSNYEGGTKNWFAPPPKEAIITTRSAPAVIGSRFSFGSLEGDLPVSSTPHSHLNFAVPYPGLNVNVNIRHEDRPRSQGHFDYATAPYDASTKNYHYAPSGSAPGNPWSAPISHTGSHFANPFTESAPALRSSADEQRQIFQIPQSSFAFAASR